MGFFIFVAGCLLWAWPSGASASEWAIIRRGEQFAQTGDAAPSTPQGGRIYVGDIRVRTDAEDDLELAVEAPTRRILALHGDSQIPGFSYAAEFNNLASFQSEFASGLNRFFADEGTGMPLEVFRILTPDPILDPAIRPLRILNLAALRRADAARDLRVEFDPAGLNDETDLVWLELLPISEDRRLAWMGFPGDPGYVRPSSGVIVIPKNQLAQNVVCDAYLSVTRLKSVDTRSVPNVILASGNYSETSFTLSTRSGDPPPPVGAVSWGLFRRGARFLQFSDAPPILNREEEAYAVEFYVRANPAVAAGAEVRLPGGRSEVFEEEPVLPGFFLADELETPSELLARYPAGDYTFNVLARGGGLASSFKIQASAAPIDASLLPVRVRNWSALQVLDPGQDTRVEFDALGFNPATDHLRFSLIEEDSELAMTTGLLPGDPNRLDASAGFFLIPRGALRAEKTYIGALDNMRLPSRDSTSLPGATLASASFVTTFFRIRTDTAGSSVGGALAIRTEELPLGFRGAEYRATLLAKGGTPPYRWSLVPGSTPLPPGLTLNEATGVLQGTTPSPVLTSVNVRVLDAANASVQTEFFLLVLPGEEPFIWLDPLSETVEQGDDVELEVFATGAEPLLFQWQRNGVDLPGETDSVLELDSVTPTSRGDYTVVVRNALGTVVSRPARISILAPPTIVRQPQSQSVAQGARVEFSVGVEGTGPFRYQWQLNGEDIPGATRATLVIPSAQLGDFGDYSVVVEAPDGAVDSQEASLLIAVPALPFSDRFATRQSINTAQGVGIGSNANATREAGEPLHAQEDGGASVWIEWVAPATGIASFRTAGSDFDTVLAVYTGSTLATLQEVASDEDGGNFFTSVVQFNAVQGIRYAIAIDGYFGEEGSIVLAWELNTTSAKLPRITAQPRDQIVRLGNQARFEIRATSEPPDNTPIRYQWFRNGEVLPGATRAELVVPQVGLVDLGLYQVTVQNDAGSLRSFFVVLLVSEMEGLLDADIGIVDKFANAVPLSRPPLGVFLRKASLKHDAFDGTGTAAARGYSGTQIFNSFGSTTEEREPNHCGVIGGASQWFTYQAEADGLLLVSTEGSSFDTVLAVYTGTGTDLQSLKLEACDNDSGVARASRVQLNVKAGTLYFVAVDGVNGATGNARLTYLLDSAPKLSVPRVQNGQLRMSINAQVGRAYSLQSSTDLKTWKTVRNASATQTTLEFTDAQPAAGTAIYYRVFSGR